MTIWCEEEKSRAGKWVIRAAGFTNARKKSYIASAFERTRDKEARERRRAGVYYELIAGVRLLIRLDKAGLGSSLGVRGPRVSAWPLLLVHQM